MTQIYVTIGIITLIGLLACYVFIRQTTGNRKEEKGRLNRAMLKRAKELQHMLALFPEHFIPKEICVFIYRSIIDIYQQLCKLEPKESSHMESLTALSSTLENVIKQPENRKIQHIQNTAQINELRQYSGILMRFLHKSAQRKNITSKQLEHYLSLIKGLTTQLTVDTYIIAAKQALEAGKPKLGIHNYELAKQLLIKETPNGHKEQTAHITSLLAPLLKSQEADAAQQSAEAQDTNDDDDNKWAQFEEDSGWKKKNVYD